MSQGENIGYSIWRIFIILFVLTALEVAWGMFFREPRWFLWSGLLICALFKGLLIFMYFMHMKFERWIVWSLIVPTPVLMLVVMGALMPDLAFNSVREHPVGHMMNEEGVVIDSMSVPNIRQPGSSDLDAAGH